MTSATLSPAVAAWRSRYYAFRNARRALARGDDESAARELAGQHAGYVRDRLSRLADDDGRIARLLGAAPPVRETAPPSNQAPSVAARLLAEQLEDRLKFAAVDGYWSTSHATAARMVALAGIVAGERVLEPSAGSGRLVEAVLASEPFANVDAFELAIPCREVLVVKQRYLTFSLAGSNFLNASTSSSYDVVLMHPPLAGAAGHVVKAFGHVRAGGRLVAVLADASIFAGDRENQRLRALVDAHAVDAEGELIAGGIGDAPAMPGRLYVLRKPS